MAGEMRRREPSRDEQQRMREQLLELGWQWARRLADLGYDDPPWSAYDGDPDQQRTSTAARAGALRHLAAVLAQAVRDDARHAGEPAEGGPTAWWTRDDVVAYLADVGAPLAADTWSGYVARGQAPAPGRHLGRTPLWDPAEVRAWQAARRGRGWRRRSGNYDPPWLSTAIAAQTAEFYTAGGRRLALHHPDVPALPEHVMGDIAAAAQNAGSCIGDSWAINSYARWTRWSWPAGHGGDPNAIAATVIPVARQLADAHGWTVEIDPGRSSHDDRP
jgi:hypothetical protein